MGVGVVLGGAEEDVVELAAQRVGTSLRAPPNPPPRHPCYVSKEEKERV
jgi:hypothetical protein